MGQPAVQEVGFLGSNRKLLENPDKRQGALCSDRRNQEKEIDSRNNQEAISYENIGTETSLRGKKLKGFI